MKEIILPDVETQYIIANKVRTRVEKRCSESSERIYTKQGQILRYSSTGFFGGGSINTYREDGWTDTRKSWSCTSESEKATYYNDREKRLLHQLFINDMGRPLYVLYRYNQFGLVTELKSYFHNLATVYKYDGEGLLVRSANYSWQSINPSLWPYGKVNEDDYERIYYTEGHLDSIISNAPNTLPYVKIYDNRGLLIKTKIHRDPNVPNLNEFPVDSCVSTIRYAYYK